MPKASPITRSRLAVGAVVTLCVLALLAGAAGSAPSPVAGRDLSDQIAAARSSQRYAEQLMLAQDRAVAALKRDRKAVKRDLKRAKRDLKRAKRTLARAKAGLAVRRQRYADALGLYDEPALAPNPKAYAERLKRIRRDIRITDRRKTQISRRVRAYARSVNGKRARLRTISRARRAAAYRRDVAEGALASHILRMTQLAEDRVQNKIDVGIVGATSLSWPTTGRISQTYGCTGFRLNPRRGSCRHFHDGIDIVDRAGTAIRSVAPGVIAYAGWNPWDQGSRAWIIVVVHRQGFVSRYGHMTPTQRVRVGEVVHTGQIIGKMGNTGRSTGTHLHYELLVNGKDVNPLSYLPAGVIKVDKGSTKAGKRAQQAKQKAKQQARQKARQKAKQKAAEQEAAQETGVPVPDMEMVICEPTDGAGADTGVEGVEGAEGADGAGSAEPTMAGSCEVVPVSASAQSRAAESSAGPGGAGTRSGSDRGSRLGVPYPPRGTSPVPS